jgi:chromosome segregation ATPase
MFLPKGVSMKIAEFAKMYKQKVGTIHTYIRNHEADFTEHIHKSGRIIELDEKAVKLLEKQYKTDAEKSASKNKVEKTEDAAKKLQDKAPSKKKVEKTEDDAAKKLQDKAPSKRGRKKKIVAEAADAAASQTKETKASSRSAKKENVRGTKEVMSAAADDNTVSMIKKLLSAQDEVLKAQDKIVSLMSENAELRKQIREYEDRMNDISRLTQK